jgi:rhodanese-related sulfurtransferase
MLEFWIDPQSLYFKGIFGSGKKFIFHCAAGSRSERSVITLSYMRFKSAHILNGFSGWLEAGEPVERSTQKPENPK